MNECGHIELFSQDTEGLTKTQDCPYCRIDHQETKLKTAIKLFIDQDYEYNKKTNALIDRHSQQISMYQSQLKTAVEALENIKLQIHAGTPTCVIHVLATEALAKIK